VVFEHIAHVPEPDELHHPTVEIVTELLAARKTDVKLTCLYNDTKVGPPTYPDSVAVAGGLAKAAPDRVLWGRDWPHPTEQPLNRTPKDALLRRCP
jgi:D-galactarolactone isomerase